MIGRKLRKVLISFGLVLILAACTTKGLAPSEIDNSQIEFVVLKTRNKEDSKKTRTYLCKFSADNTYQSYEGGSPLHAGNFSYSRKGSNHARLVFSYSENNALKSYEANLNFETPSSGTWESSYNDTQSNASSGTFKFI